MRRKLLCSLIFICLSVNLGLAAEVDYSDLEDQLPPQTVKQIPRTSQKRTIEEPSALGFSMHIKTDGALGSMPSIGFHFGNFEVLGGIQVLNRSVSLLGESISISGQGPYIGGKVYIIKKNRMPLGLFIGGDYGKATISLKCSEDSIHESIKEYGLDEFEFVFSSAYLGAEYYLDQKQSFSISTEIGYKSQEFIANIKNVAGLDNVVVNDSGTYYSVGLNYYF